MSTNTYRSEVRGQECCSVFSVDNDNEPISVISRTAQDLLSFLAKGHFRPFLCNTPTLCRFSSIAMGTTTCPSRCPFLSGSMQPVHSSWLSPFHRSISMVLALERGSYVVLWYSHPSKYRFGSCPTPRDEWASEVDNPSLGQRLTN